jgi:hypothetical protein
MKLERATPVPSVPRLLRGETTKIMRLVRANVNGMATAVAVEESGQSVSGSQRTRLRLGRLASTTIQAGEDIDFQTGIHVHRALQQHGTAALVTGPHGGNPITPQGFIAIRQKTVAP